jgi:hypothetical protein
MVYFISWTAGRARGSPPALADIFPTSADCQLSFAVDSVSSALARRNPDFTGCGQVLVGNSCEEFVLTYG